MFYYRSSLENEVYNRIPGLCNDGMRLIRNFVFLAPNVHIYYSVLVDAMLLRYAKYKMQSTKRLSVPV